MKRNLLLLLSAAFLLEILRSGLGIVPHFIIIVSTALITDFLLLRINKIPPFFPSAGVITGMIISFILHPSAGLSYKILAPFLAILSKHLILIKNRHVFNPAAFGLIVTSFFGSPVSWWIDGSWILTRSILVVSMVFILLRVRRIRILISYLISFFILNLLIYQNISIWSSLSAALNFFPLVMVTEPMTSPSDYREQSAFSSLVVFLSMFFSFSGVVPVDSFLSSLLITNFLYRAGFVRKGVDFLQI